MTLAIEDLCPRRSVRPDATLRRLAPKVWVGGSPLKLFRLTGTGDAVVDELCRRGEATGSSRAQTDLLDRLVLAGAAHPLPEASPQAPRESEVTVVVPVRDRPRALGELLAGVRATVPAAAIIVVDDGSLDADSVAAVAAHHGAILLRHDESLGPAAARNAGLSMVRTPLAAFVDSDIHLEGHWLTPLLAQLVDRRVALIAPRVRSEPGPGLLARYECGHSPLDLGPSSAAVVPRGRVSYVPAAVLVARVEVLASLGGFDEAMRVGEDVDLVWRAVDAGHLVRYEPASEVTHTPRPDWGSWAAQRFEYGLSAAALDSRHRGAVAPVVCSASSAATWSLIALGHPVAGSTVGVGSAIAFTRKLAGVPPAAAMQVVLRGHLGAGRQLSRAGIRPWWPILLAGSLVSRRGRRVALAVLAGSVVSSDGGLGQRCLAIADDAVYSAGVWVGAVRARRFGALLPSTPKWP